MFGLAITAAVFFGYALVSRRLASTIITGPIVFTIFGLILATEGLNLFSLGLESSITQLLLEGTLVVVLFSDAAAIDLRAARHEASLPGRLLGIGLPLTIISGTLAALVFFDTLPFWQAAVIAIVLAPTDAALGKSTVSNRSVPLAVRQGITVESGLNDGIVVPFLAIALAGTAGEMQTLGGVVSVFVGEIGWAVAAGGLVGWAGGKAIVYAGLRGWTSHAWRLIAVPMLAVAAFAIANPLGGSGFLAAFVAGTAFGTIVRATYPDICAFSDELSEYLTMVAFFVFGALILAPSLPMITWEMFGFAIVILTIGRMIPVAIALVGTRMRLPTVLYLGWFGPRGLASLVFAGTVVVEADLVGGLSILAVVSTVVATSIVAHGVTAVPWSSIYAHWWVKNDEASEDMAESQPVKVMPHRIRLEGISGPPADPPPSRN